MNWAGELLTLGLVWPGRLDAGARPCWRGQRGGLNRAGLEAEKIQRLLLVVGEAEAGDYGLGKGRRDKGLGGAKVHGNRPDPWPRRWSKGDPVQIGAERKLNDDWEKQRRGVAVT